MVVTPSSGNIKLTSYCAFQSALHHDNSKEILVERGVKPEQKRFFIIDGSKALRAGITEVFGKQPVQRCRLHKERNVVEPLPEGQQEEVCEQMRSAWKLPAEQGIAQLEKLARSLEKSAPWRCQELAGRAAADVHHQPTRLTPFPATKLQ